MRAFIQRTFLSAGCLLLALNASANTFFVDANGTNPVAPFVDWNTAATNIQDAIDASSDGDVVLVTNGVYASGGRSMDGVITNRVSLNKAITVQSASGPFVTTIQGWGPTNGTSAVRCAWITNNAALIGFTLKWGATRTGSGQSLFGGAVYGASSNLAVVANSVIISNNSANGAVYQASVRNSLIATNANLTYAAYQCVLRNCTVVTNSEGLQNCAAINSIIYYNSSPNFSSSIAYCCVSSVTAGPGNFTNAPQLFVDGVHLTSGSPCIGAGTNITFGTDIFGNAWANPPSVGCAEWKPNPIVAMPRLALASDPVGFTITANSSGQSALNFGWLKDGVLLQDNGHFAGTQTTNLVALGIGLNDVGGYQLVASNSSGAVTSSVVNVVAHYVDPASTNVNAPYTTWNTAATNIQDAISAAAAGELIFVTNGIYASGGKSTDGIITNRVVVDKGIIVQSVNGPAFTTIQGGGATNGPSALRCVWLTNTAVLSGFTLTAGATRTFSSPPNYGTINGGAVWGSSNSATVFNCSLVTNSAGYWGGAAYQVKLLSCQLLGNTAGTYGGAASSCILRQCLVTSNYASSAAGGTDLCSLTNCALIGNSTQGYGSAAQGRFLVNCTGTE